MKFTIRDLLWLTVVVALALAWLWDRRNAEERYQKLRILWSDAIDQTVDSQTEVALYAKFADLYWSQPENAAEYRQLTGREQPNSSKPD